MAQSAKLLEAGETFHKDEFDAGRGDGGGAAAMLVALAAPALVVLAALAVDAALWAAARTEAQSAADSAALSAASVAAAGHGRARAMAEAQAVAAANGLVDGRDGVRVDVDHPPRAGVHVGDAAAWEVRIARRRAYPFVGIFGLAPVAAARATAWHGAPRP